MFRKQRHILVALLLAVAVVVPVGTAVAGQATRTTVPARLVGTWGKTMTHATWHKNAVEFEPSGPWAIVITNAGVTSLFEPPGKPESSTALTTMSVAATGASVVFGQTADGYCPGKASYRWKVSGRTLTLKVVKDDCTARRVLLTAGSWKRK